MLILVYHAARRTYKTYDAKRIVTKTWTDAAGRTVEQFSATLTLSGQTPTGREAIYKSDLKSRTAYTYDEAGRIKTQRVYSDADATSGGYDETIYRYGFTASSPYRPTQTVIGPPASASDSTRTWRKTVADVQGRTWKVYEGAGSYTDESTSEPGNMQLLAQAYFDGEEATSTKIGDGHVTRSRTFLAHSPSETYTDVDSQFDTEGRLVVQLLPGDVATKTTYDFQGRATVNERWERSGSTLTTLLAKSETAYDELGRAYQAKVYKVESGTASDYLKSDTYHDIGNLVRKTVQPGGVVARTDYDGADRTTASWAETSTGTVLSRTDYALNKVGAAVAVRSKALKSSATGQTDADFLFSYAATWYDAGWRPEVSGFNGDKNTGSWWPTPPAKPSASDANWLVTKVEYDSAGRTYKTYDAKGIVTKSEYDDAGRLTRTTEDDGGIARVTELTYNGDGQVLTRMAKAPATGEGDQTTTYYYNTIDNTNGVQSAEKATTGLLAKVRYPDHDDPQGTSGEVKMKYNLAAQLVERVDQRGTKVTPVYDAAGRMTMQYIDGTNTTGGPLPRATGTFPPPASSSTRPCPADPAVITSLDRMSGPNGRRRMGPGRREIRSFGRPVLICDDGRRWLSSGVVGRRASGIGRLTSGVGRLASGA